jgi:preprotein translocase subunit SecE
VHGFRRQGPDGGVGGYTVLRRTSGVAVNPAKFLREVRAEAVKVTWPSRKETLVTTGLVFAMAALAAIFFFVVDQIIGIGVRALFGAGI